MPRNHRSPSPGPSKVQQETASGGPSTQNYRPRSPYYGDRNRSPSPGPYGINDNRQRFDRPYYGPNYYQPPPNYYYNPYNAPPHYYPNYMSISQPPNFHLNSKPVRRMEGRPGESYQQIPSQNPNQQNHSKPNPPSRPFTVAQYRAQKMTDPEKPQ